MKGFRFVSAGPVLSPRLLSPTVPRHALPYPLSAPRCHPFYVGRYGLYRLFQSLGYGPRDTVLVPSYHQGNEVLAIRATGARVTFYTIGRDLQPDLSEIRALAVKGARALLTIHYGGWPQPIRALLALSRELGLHLVEDCALALLSESEGQPLGSFGDDALFCLYKTLPIPNGAAVVQNRSDPSALRDLPQRSCGTLSLAGRSLELGLGWWRHRYEASGAALFAAKQAVGRGLSAFALPRHPVGDEGFDGRRADLRMSGVSTWLLPRFDFAAIRALRRRNYALLQERLGGEPGAFGPLPEGACPLFYPLFVRDKPELVRRLQLRGIGATPLWNNGDPTAWDFADTRFLRTHVVDLPIHQDVTEEHIEYMAEVLRDLGNVTESLSWSISSSSTTRPASTL